MRTFAVTLDGEPSFGWRLRSVSAPVRDAAGWQRWLRVVTEQSRWLPHCSWTGNLDANLLDGITKPLVLDTAEWFDPTWNRQVRAEIMTRMAGRSCSTTPELRGPIALPDSWWEDLHRALALLRGVSTQRTTITTPTFTTTVRDVFGPGTNVEPLTWSTVHGDLHWGNLRRPRFGLVDWELWGIGSTGLDEATLYCTSLLTPDVAAEVHARFGSTLDSRTGRIAQLYVCARLLRRADEDFPDLAPRLRLRGDAMLESLAS